MSDVVPEPLPWQEAYDENGVDRTLVRYTLGLTPTERLRGWQSVVDLVKAAHKVEATGVGPLRRRNPWPSSPG
ncbi:MAG TPA: hypothetical protein VJT73_15775 [Polyangiaceae bacterium]|nr:hypothetical protein [Polyangiaceae bacterium]